MIYGGLSDILDAVCLLVISCSGYELIELVFPDRVEFGESSEM